MIYNTWDDVDVLLHTGVWNEPKNLPGIEIPMQEGKKFLNIDNEDYVIESGTVLTVREDFYNFAKNRDEIGSNLLIEFLTK